MRTALDPIIQAHNAKIGTLNPNSDEWRKEHAIITSLTETNKLLKAAFNEPEPTKTPAELESEKAYPPQYWEGMEPSLQHPHGVLKELTLTSSDLQEAYEKGRTHAPTQGEIDTATKVILTELHHMGIECIGQEKAQDIAYQTLNTVRNYMNGDRQ